MLIVNIQNKAKWLFSQLGQLVIAVGLLSLVFNYAYRYTVDRHIDTAVFYEMCIRDRYCSVWGMSLAREKDRLIVL